MRFTALAIPNTHSTVMSADHSSDRNTRSQNGTRKTAIETPDKCSTTPAAATPAALAGGDSFLMSS